MDLRPPAFLVRFFSEFAICNLQIANCNLSNFPTRSFFLAPRGSGAEISPLELTPCFADLLRMG
jgi:hypothetical protein